MTITFAELKTEVLRLAAEYPDTVYPKVMEERSLRQCYYTKGECGPGVGCIFGQALTNLDSSLAVRLAAMDADDMFNTGIGNVVWKLGISATNEEETWCDSVQAAQDNSRRWADAVCGN